MSPTTSERSDAGLARRARQALDAVVYALAVAALVFVLGGLIGLVTGGGLVTAKYVMFVVGILLFGYATFQLRPDPPWSTDQTKDGETTIVKNDDSNEPVVGGRTETRFQAAVQRIPPLSRYSLPPSDRISIAAKLFLASLVTLAWSYVMEAAFGVAA